MVRKFILLALVCILTTGCANNTSQRLPAAQLHAPHLSEEQQLVATIKDRTAPIESRRQAFIKFWDQVLYPGCDLVTVSKRVDLSWALDPDLFWDVTNGSGSTPIRGLTGTWSWEQYQTHGEYIIWAPDKIPNEQQVAHANFALTKHVDEETFRKCIRDGTEGELIVFVGTVSADTIFNLAVEASDGTTTRAVRSIDVYSTGAGHVMTDPFGKDVYRDAAYFRLTPAAMEALQRDIRGNVYRKGPDGVPEYVTGADPPFPERPASAVAVKDAAAAALIKAVREGRESLPTRAPATRPAGSISDPILTVGAKQQPPPERWWILQRPSGDLIDNRSKWEH